ncbi:MAG: AIPR family protein [Candidatus Sumerlaeia bacterium]|nr:AIPR family protein [Candidatus Sumerlaeia bacterium]
MSINIGIVDQQIIRLMGTLSDEHGSDEARKRSKAFVLLVAKTILDLDDDEAQKCLQDGGNDAGVDAIYVGEIQHSEFTVTIIQGKYKQRQDGESAFPANDVLRVVNTVGALFDPYAEVFLHDELLYIVEEIRSLVKDGAIPRVRVILANNGKRWNREGQQHIDHAAFGDQVTFEHVNHDTIVSLLQKPRSVSAQLLFTGSSIVEEFNFRRVLIGRVHIQQLKELFDQHGDTLLERNIRRYLGLHGNRVNLDIQETLLNDAERPNFYFYNNGVTMICSQLRRNALQGSDHIVRIENLQIINGGQTCKTIQSVLDDHPQEDYSHAYVLVRLYELDAENDDLVRQITYATNSQNPVDLRDLRSNDNIQKALETSIDQLGYTYIRKRESNHHGSKSISVTVAAEAILSIWRRQPHVAKFRSRELFGNYYHQVFNKSLNGAQLVLAVHIYRYADAMRKRPHLVSKLRFISYAHNFIAMEMGRLLLREAKLTLKELDHRNFRDVNKLLEDRREHLFKEACYRVAAGIKLLGLSLTDTSLQRLSAAFRRSDLLDILGNDAATRQNDFFIEHGDQTLTNVIDELKAKLDL